MKKWLIALNSLIIITTPAVANIILNNQSETTIVVNDNQTIDVNISAYDKDDTKLMSYHYETQFATLGELMAQETETYLLKDFGGNLGLYLYGINYYDEQGNKQTKLEETNETFWAFWYLNDQGEEEFSDVGISSYYLTHKVENIIWRYTDIWKN